MERNIELKKFCAPKCTNTSDLVLKGVKIFLRKFCYKRQKIKQKSPFEDCV